MYVHAKENCLSLREIGSKAKASLSRKSPLFSVYGSVRVSADTSWEE